MGFELPNTTPVPNEIINGWAKKLKGSELKVLLIVTRKTLGWIADPTTGMRKEEDWITYKQLKEMTGLSNDGLTNSIATLSEKHKLIEIRDENGVILDSPAKREKVGERRGKLIYRLNVTVLKSTSHYFEKQNSTVPKTRSYKTNSYKTNSYKIDGIGNKTKKFVDNYPTLPVITEDERVRNLERLGGMKKALWEK